MTAAETNLVASSELERVERWRSDALERAGYPRDAAARLEQRLVVDLHVAIGLLDRGCTPELALEILL